MRHTKILLGLLAVIALVLIVGSYSALSTLRANEEAEIAATYIEMNQHVYGLGDVAELDSRIDEEEGGSYGWTGHFGWEGALSLSIKDVDLLSIDDNKLRGWINDEDLEFARKIAVGKLRVAMATVQISNIDAITDGSGGGKYRFNSDMLSVDDDIGAGEWVYFDASVASFDEIKNRTNELMNYFVLKPGKTKVIHIGWYVDENELEDGLIVRICGKDKYRFEIPSVDIKRSKI